MNRLTATESLVSIRPDFSYITQDQNAVNNTFVQQPSVQKNSIIMEEAISKLLESQCIATKQQNETKLSR